MALFSTAYWAPTSYYLLATQSNRVQIEQYEFYQKQSYRNRCTILSANGPLSLVVPILRPHQRLIRDIRIDYSKPWQRIHWRAIEAAYRSAAYFQEYHQEVLALYQRETPFLFDLNLQTWELGRKLLALALPWSFTASFAPVANHSDDYRNQIHPKRNRLISLQPYFQVFANKFGFVPDLSILDLIFNEAKIFLPLYD